MWSTAIGFQNNADPKCHIGLLHFLCSFCEAQYMDADLHYGNFPYHFSDRTVRKLQKKTEEWKVKELEHLVKWKQLEEYMRCGNWSEVVLLRFKRLLSAL